MTKSKSAAGKTASQPKISKRQQLIDLLKKEGGTSLDEMVAALGWLPHTTRAALTGLRKAGTDVQSEKIEGVRRYRIVAAAA